MLVMYVVYKNPIDYPGKYVVRRVRVHNSGVTSDAEPLAVTDTLEAAHEVIPPGLIDMKQPGDDPAIYEVWV